MRTVRRCWRANGCASLGRIELDLADLKARLEAQLAAVVEAEQAIARVHHLCGLPLPVERVDGACLAPSAAVVAARSGKAPIVPADPSARVLGPTDGQQSAMRSCPGCGTQFERVAPAQRYCGEPCRIRLRNQRAYQRKRARADAAERAQTAAIVEQNRNEGYDNLTWSNGHAET
jgi:hypothetical protein